MTYVQTVRLLLFGLLLSGSVSCYLFSLHLFFLLNRFAKDVQEVMVTWEMIGSYLIVGSVLLVVSFMIQRRQS